MGTHSVNIAVVAHDAGASEILCAFIKAHFDKAKWTLCSKKGSPFEKIALREGLKTQEELNMQEYDALFFGTGWQDHFERPFVREAKKSHLPCFAFLDHWSAYRERFSYPQEHWEENLPHFTVVSDKKAEKLARDYQLPQVLRINNLYLQNQLDSIDKNGLDTSDNLLFLSEPTDKVALSTYADKNYWGFTQESALEEILKNFERFGCSGLHIRLHPSEETHAYKNILKKFPHIKSQIYPAAFYPLEKDLLRSKVIIGFDTMALYTAALLKRPVISFLPSKNREFLLPLPPSHQLRDLSELRAEHLKPFDISLDSDGMDFADILRLIKGYRTC